MPRRGSQPPFLNLPLLIVILPTVALIVFLFFAFYASTSTTSPHRTLRVGASNSTVKKGWDSLNAFLVLFAILCGIFAKRNDDESPPNEEDGDNHLASRALPVQRGRTAVSDQWFHQLSEDKFYDETTPLRRLTRSSSSYPDLRQESLWETENDRFRFFDDFEIREYRQSSAPLVSGNRPYKSPPIASDEEEKEIPVDTSALRSLPPPSTPPKSPPPATAKHMPKRTYTTIPRKEVEIKIKSPPPPPLAPPQPAAKENGSERRIERKKSNTAKEIKMVFTSLYNNSQRKRKKKTKDINSRDEPLDSGLEPASFTRPPPPPPPPPSSLFRNLFRKGSKSKRIHSYSAPPPPPPPPPVPPISVLSKRKARPPPPPTPPPPVPRTTPPQPISISRRKARPPSPTPPPPVPRTTPPQPISVSRRKARPPPPAPPPPVPRATPPPEPSKRTSSPANSWKPPLPPTAREKTFLEDFDNFGGQSPLIPMPPPPPPPFKVPGFRFVVKGDYVKVGSANSSRSTSPEPAEIERESKEKVDTGGGGGPVFCPSPDVNVKADTFIAMLRDGWRLDGDWRRRSSG